jgi:dolichyl-phosphate-mannose-protein mannosyltransferase
MHFPDFFKKTIIRTSDSPTWRFSALELVLGVIVSLTAGIGTYVRLVFLGFPNHMVSDEHFFVDTARYYIHGVWHMHDHPAFGKFLLAIGILIVGDTPTGWRIVPALIGIATIVLCALVTTTLFKNKVAAAFVVIFTALDGLFVSYSHLALLDQIIVALALLTFLVILRSKKPLVAVFVAGSLIGLLAATKYTGIGILIPALFILVQRKQYAIIPLTVLWAALIYVEVAILGQLLTKATNPFLDAWSWQLYSWGFHTGPIPAYYWASRWYTWPLELVPVGHWQFQDSEGKFTLVSFANPILIWTTTALLPILALISTLPKRILGRIPLTSQPVILLLICYASYFLPWAIIKRAAFFYHYFPSYAFLLILLAGVFGYLWQHFSWTRVFLLLYCLIISGASIYFMPFALGQPLSNDQYKSRIWLKSWDNPSEHNWASSLK